MDFISMLGYNNSAYIQEVFTTAGASNVFTEDNPQFTASDFYKTFPKFHDCDNNVEIPDYIISMFINIADHSIKERRFKTMWKYCMCLYVAHLATLYLQVQNEVPGSAALISSAMPRGIAASKSVDALSISYDYQGVSEDLKGYGTFKYTVYGQQLATYARMYRGAGMWVNG